MGIQIATGYLVEGLKKPWVIFILALVTRLIVVSMGYAGDPQDTPEYDEIAHNLLTGNGFVMSNWWHGFELRSWRAPFYPFFLAGVYGVVGYSQLTVRICQCVVGAFTAVLVMVLGRKLDARIAPLCGGLAVFYGPLVSISNEVMTETWFAFWGVLSAFMLVSGRTVLGGGALGMGMLTRPVGVFYVLALGLMGVIRRQHWQRRMWAIGIAFLVVLPWTLRNYAVHGAWPILSTQGGFIAARSNAAEPDWRKAIGWGVDKHFLEQMPIERDRDQYWWREAIGFVAQNPGTYVKLVGERFLRFWYFFHPWYNAWFMTVLPLFVYGFFKYWQRSDYLLLTFYFCVSLLFFCTVLYANSRFRLPLMPFFLIFASAGVLHLVDRHGMNRVMGFVCGLAFVNLIVAWQADGLRSALLTLLSAFGLK